MNLRCVAFAVVMLGALATASSSPVHAKKKPTGPPIKGKPPADPKAPIKPMPEATKKPPADKTAPIKGL